jgi:hypothetical protein
MPSMLNALRSRADVRATKKSSAKSAHERRIVLSIVKTGNDCGARWTVGGRPSVDYMGDDGRCFKAKFVSCIKKSTSKSPACYSGRQSKVWEARALVGKCKREERKTQKMSE